MKKPKFETPNLTTENIAKIAELFPGVVTEGKVNFDLLRSMLGDDVFGDEAYEFTWVGKRAAIAEAGRPIRKTLRPCVEESKNWDTTKNLYIEGDNLDVLKLLQESYFGKVKMIYIDPPYNTGKDSFLYPDNFSCDDELYDEMTELYDENGNHNYKTNEVSNPRFHSDWCSMIYPRLKLARNLLKSDGVVFISIDEKEVTNLIKICDEVFGSKNHLETFHIQVRYENKSLNEDSDFQPIMEYVLVYSNNSTFFIPGKPSEPYDLSKFIYSFEELTEGKTLNIGNKEVTIFKKGEWCITKHDTGKIGLLKETWASGSIVKQSGTAAEFLAKYLINRKKDDGLSVLYKIHNMGEDGIGYRYVTGPIKTDAIRGKFYTGVPLERIKEIKCGTALKYKPITNYYDHSGDFGNIRHEGGVAFNSGKKPIKMLEHLLFIANLDNNDIVLDFFSGSASIAHAVMKYNVESKKKTKFVLVQINETLNENDDLFREGYKTICEIGKERIRRAGEKIKAEANEATAQNLDIGFRVLKLDDTNMNDVYYAPGEYTQEMLPEMESNIKPDRTDMDLLFACLLDWGLPLSMPHTHETIDGFTVHTYNDGDLIACFQEHISEKAVREIAARKPLRAVFRDSSFTSSPEKINVFEIFKMITPNTSIRVI